MTAVQPYPVEPTRRFDVAVWQGTRRLALAFAVEVPTRDYGLRRLGSDRGSEWPGRDHTRPPIGGPGASGRRVRLLGRRAAPGFRGRLPRLQPAGSGHTGRIGHLDHLGTMSAGHLSGVDRRTGTRRVSEARPATEEANEPPVAVSNDVADCAAFAADGNAVAGGEELPALLLSGPVATRACPSTISATGPSC